MSLVPEFWIYLDFQQKQISYFLVVLVFFMTCFSVLFSIAEVCCNCKVVLISACPSENKASSSDTVNILTKCNAW